MIDLERCLRVDASRPTAHEGFVYVPDEEPGDMAAASPGATVGDQSDAPPWIVVDHTPYSAILAKWPGKLWKVRVLRRASQQPLPYATYTRATRVKVLEECSLGSLFPNNGDQIVELLCGISTLTIDSAMRMWREPAEEAVAIHDLVWDRWLAQQEPSSPFLGVSHAGTIAVGTGAKRSPVGHATSVLHGELWRRAKSLVGDMAFCSDEDGEYLAPPWQNARETLQHMLFGVGVGSNFIDDRERRVLCRGFVQ